MCSSDLVFDVFEREFADAGAWLSHVGFSPASRDLAERWQGVLCTCEKDIAVADFQAADRFDGAPLAGKVRAPVLVVGGADDLLTPPAMQHAIGAAISGAQVTIVPEAGHFVMLERPDRFFRELEQFLEFTS